MQLGYENAATVEIILPKVVNIDFFPICIYKTSQQMEYIKMILNFIKEEVAYLNTE